MEEIWKPIPEYEEYYEISNTGKIRSLTRAIIRKNGSPLVICGKELKQQIAKGYYRVTLTKNNIRKTYSVHRLVAITFIPNPNNLPIINHKDENKLNNNVNNLEWCTVEYNNNYGTREERISKTLVKNQQHPIIMCDKNTHEPIKEFFNARVAAEYFNAKDSSNIHRVLSGKGLSAYGFWWTYKKI